MDDLLQASALDQAQAVRAGEVSAVELVEAALRRAEAVQSELNAFTVLDGERAVAAAAGMGPGDPRPFAGVPFAVKDLALACEGLPLTNGSDLFGDYVPPYDSVAVARARAAGLVVIGKTVSAELGALVVTEPRRYGPVRNPFDRERTAGGSSGGAAAAVAGGALAIASASDAGGSIRVPAACCGLVGLKPARGRVSLAPELGEHPLAVEGCVTRRVADSAAFLDAVAGPAPGDATWAPPPAVPFSAAVDDDAPRRIGVCTQPSYGGAVDSERVHAVTEVAAALAELGHEVEEVPGDPWPFAEVRDAFLDVFAVGAAAFAGFGEAVGGRPAGPETLEPWTWKVVQRGRELPATALAASQHALHTWSRAVVVALSGYDAVLSPALSGPPLPLGRFTGAELSLEDGIDRVFTFAAFAPVANVTGLPALALPAGRDAAGLPLAVQLLGRAADEATLIALGAQLEKAR